MNSNLNRSLFALVMTFMLAFMTGNAVAQVSGQAFSGFQSNSKSPVQIEADELEVLDEQGKAVFTGKVKVRQGSSLITTSKLIVTYLKGSDGGQGDIDRLDMSGGLIATSKENTVSAKKGTYFVGTEKIILTGDVVVSQGGNVASGCKLQANLKNNRATLQACKGGGRVKSVFTPGSQKKN